MQDSCSTAEVTSLIKDSSCLTALVIPGDADTLNELQLLMKPGTDKEISSDKIRRGFRTSLSEAPADLSTTVTQQSGVKEQGRCINDRP